MNKEDLRENRIHGNPLFPMGIYPDNRAIFECHWHEEMEFILVTEGKAFFQIGVSEFEVNEGEALFIHSGDLHSGFDPCGSAFHFTAIVFHPELLSSRTFDITQEKYIDPLLKKEMHLPSHIKGNEPWERNVLARLRDLIQANQNRAPGFELATKAHLYLMFADIFAGAPLTAAHKSHSAAEQKMERLKQALHFIHTHYDEQIKLKTLAGVINMSEEHFCRFFKQMVRKSPIEYINHYRMQKAAYLLKHSDKKVMEIAMDVGFDNLSYFISVFKSCMNITPSQYRKALQDTTA